MSLRDAFLKALAVNEDDAMTRLVYADWLDEQGEHEEADRQRKWPAAKEWLVAFCRDNSRDQEISYDELIDFGCRAVKEDKALERVYFDNEDTWHALQSNSQAFWKNWSIVTGQPLPPSLETKGFHFWQCCSHEVYYWFGSPDSEDADE